MNYSPFTCRARRSVFILTAILCVFCAYGVAAAAEVSTGEESNDGGNLLSDPSFERIEIEKDKSAWSRYRAGVEPIDGAVRVRNGSADDHGGIFQRIDFDPPVFARFRFGAKSRAESADDGGTYAVYLDVHYADGSALWAQKATFAPGTHDWEISEAILTPERPIKQIEFFILFREASGTVDFDDAFLERLPMTFDVHQTVGGLFGNGSLAARVVKRANRYGLRTRLAVAQSTKDGAFSREHVRTEPGVLTSETLGAAEPSAIETTCETTILDADGNAVHRQSESVDTTACDAGRGYAVWTESAMKRVFLHSLPERGDQAAVREALERPSAEIELAKNESESFQIALLSPVKFKDIKVEISPLARTDDASKTVAPENVRWQQVGYIRAEQIGDHPEQPDGVPGWWPDPLLPVASGKAPANQTVAFWLTVFAPPQTEAGLYQGRVTLRPENAPAAEIPFTVRVRDFTLPDEGGLSTAFALMDGFLEKVYDRPVTPELRRAYGEFCLRHRLTPEGDISRTEPPRFDDLTAYRRRGLGAFNLLNMVAPRGSGAWRCNSPVEWYTPEHKAETLEKLAPLVEQLREAGFADQAYIYTFDESNPEYHAAMADFFGAVKERFPEVATFTTARVGTDLDLLERLHIDWTCPLTSQYRFDEAQRCRAAGKKVWSYICCGPVYPYANIMFRFPLIEARILGWQSFALRYDGLLYWGLNVWDQKGNTPIDPNRTLFLDWGAEIFIGQPIYGDGRLLYAGIDNRPIGSVRLAALRDGLEDYLYLRTLEKRLGPTQAAETIAPVFESATRFTRSPAVLSEARKRIADRVEGRNDSE